MYSKRLVVFFQNGQDNDLPNIFPKLIGFGQMYPYHNKIKQRIRNNELIGYEYVDEYKHIKPCLLLYFETIPEIRPIREYRFEEYKKILDSLDINPEND